jgi:hypothetical protein
MISLSFILFYFVFLESLNSLYLSIGCSPSTNLVVLYLIFYFRKSLIFFIIYCGMYKWMVIILLR